MPTSTVINTVATSNDWKVTKYGHIWVYGHIGNSWEKFGNGIDG